MKSAPMPDPAHQRPPINPLTVWIPIIVIALGVVVFWSYYVKLKRDQMKPRMPVLGRLERNLALTERSGKTVELQELKGKIIVASWVFTRCPRGCPGVVGEMLRLYREIGSDPRVHFLSVSVDPDDTAEQLSSFTDKFGIKGDNWWFLTGPRDAVRTYMTHYFGFHDVKDVPPDERVTPDDKFIHDMRVALVDDLGQVRGFYDIGSVESQTRELFQEKLRKDIRTLMDESTGRPRSMVGLYALMALIAGCVGFLVWMRLMEGRAGAKSGTITP
jgi:cytochrome oxidase Cu insertion factor (SCO1/SenC/PrrC family)